MSYLPWESSSFPQETSEQWTNHEHLLGFTVAENPRSNNSSMATTFDLTSLHAERPTSFVFLTYGQVLLG